MKISGIQCVALCLIASLIGELYAGGPQGRRTLKIGFEEDWGFEQTECLSPLIEFQPETLSVSWGSFSFQALRGAVLADYYCQETNAGFFNHTSFSGDEQGLANLVGENSTNEVTATRWSVLRIDRWDAQALGYGGFQWAFYRFPDDITIVALYGLIDQNSNDVPRVTVQIRNGLGLVYENASFQGEYFCFRNGTFTGTWDGVSSGSDPSVACPAPPG